MSEAANGKAKCGRYIKQVLFKARINIYTTQFYINKDDVWLQISLSLCLNFIIMIISSFLTSVFLLGLPGGSEWIVIILVALLFFGGKKIPELMRGIGKGMREFKDAKDNIKSEIEEGMKEKDKDEELRELKKQLQEKQAQELPK